MVERFHRQLKTALKCSHNPHHWVDPLPLVLLGVRTAVKDNLKCSTTEMVYGTTLRLPGELLVPTHSNALSDPLSYVDTLKDLMHQLQYQVPRSPTLRSQTIAHVFVRNDSKRPPLQPTCDGPFKVVDRKTRHFVITCNGNRIIDRLKPAYSMDTQTEHSYSSSSHQSHTRSSQPPTHTSSSHPAVRTRSG